MSVEWAKEQILNVCENIKMDIDFTISSGSDDQKYIVQKGGMDQCIVYASSFYSDPLTNSLHVEYYILPIPAV